MSPWAALAGGFAGTLVLTTALESASALGLTRMDLPFLLGSAFTPNRTRAKVIGLILQFVLGLGFALLYEALFLALGEATWWLGALFGMAHAAFVGTVLVNILLPSIHPLMGTPYTAADRSAFLEPPGFMMLNYGRTTPIVNVIAHVAYGIIIGTFVARSL